MHDRPSTHLHNPVAGFVISNSAIKLGISNLNIHNRHCGSPLGSRLHDAVQRTRRLALDMHKLKQRIRAAKAVHLHQVKHVPVSTLQH